MEQSEVDFPRSENRNEQVDRMVAYVFESLATNLWSDQTIDTVSFLFLA